MGVVLVSRDAEGLRLVLAEMLQREHDLGRLGRQAEGKGPEVKAMLLSRAKRVTLSPGYKAWAGHLMVLERQGKLGTGMGELLADEVTGLQVLAEARARHRYEHPDCFACGMPQENRFQTECLDCGAKYRKRGR